MPSAAATARKISGKKERNEPVLLLRAIPKSNAYEVSSNTSHDPEVGKLL
jgi:hypothetical protein